MYVVVGTELVLLVGTSRYGIGTASCSCVMGCRYACFSRFKVISVCVCGSRYARCFVVGTGRYAVGTWSRAGVSASPKFAWFVKEPVNIRVWGSI